MPGCSRLGLAGQRDDPIGLPLLHALTLPVGAWPVLPLALLAIGLVGGLRGPLRRASAGRDRATGWTDVRGLAGALGDEMARQLIESNVQEQADDWPEEELGECPECGGPAHKAPDQPRVLTTTRGEVAWNERVGHCIRCRRAFFPSEPSVGH